MYSSLVFKGRLLNVSVEKHRFPNGYSANIEVVGHPGAVLIIPCLNLNRVILIRQYRPVIQSYLWELPAGTLKKNESHLRCAKREMAEEIGYTASRWKRLGSIYSAPGYTTEKIVIFKAEGLQKNYADRQQEDELIRPRIFTPKKLAALLRSGLLRDAKTICALKLASII